MEPAPATDSDMRREMDSLPWDVRRRGGLDVDSELVLSLGGESKGCLCALQYLIGGNRKLFRRMKNGDEFGECCRPMIITKRGKAVSKCRLKRGEGRSDKR